MFEGTLTVCAGPKEFFYQHADRDLLKRQADVQMRKLGGTLVREVDYHDGSFVYTDGAEAVALLVISET